MSNAQLILEDGTEYQIDAESLDVRREWDRSEVNSLKNEELPNMYAIFSLAKEETATEETLPIENTTIIIRTDKEEHVIENARICGGDGNKKIEITGFSQK